MNDIKNEKDRIFYCPYCGKELTGLKSREE
jgi:predicted  nucleic acid-binding Zn-ribbon protein